MESDTPLSQLVLWVPPDIAAGWERLPADQQALFGTLASEEETLHQHG